MTAPTIVRAVQSCLALPSQWDAWDADGQYYYLRYRFGRATVDAYDSPDCATWPDIPDGQVAWWEHQDKALEPGRPCYDGEISLEEFRHNTGLTLALKETTHP